MFIAKQVIILVVEEATVMEELHAKSAEQATMQDAYQEKLHDAWQALHIHVPLALLTLIALALLLRLIVEEQDNA